MDIDGLKEQETDFENIDYLQEKEEIEGFSNEDSEEDEDVDILKNEVISYVGNYSLAEYAQKLNKDFKRPEFQRNEVWDRKAKSKLIESFLASYPVPPIFLYKEKGREEYLIIDGFQRLTTIFDFFNDKFKLNIKNDNYKNKNFAQLPEEARTKLKNTFLNCIIVREVEPSSKKFLYNLFERLNTGGKRLNAMEARRAISYGKLIQSLEELNKYENWRKIIAKKNIDNRFLDMELLLRLLAFYKEYDFEQKKLKNYSNMKMFLNEFVDNHANTQYDDFVDIFKNACDLIISELGENPFKLNSPKPNYIILDSIMGAILLKQAKIERLKEKFDNLKKEHNEIYTDKSGTLSSTKVNNRLKLAIEAL